MGKPDTLPLANSLEIAEVSVGSIEPKRAEKCPSPRQEGSCSPNGEAVAVPLPYEKYRSSEDGYNLLRELGASRFAKLAWYYWNVLAIR
jgi:hypothetical protein